MGVITIRERSQTDDGFLADLVFENGRPYEISIQNPFTPQQANELEWYFERWIRLPFTDETIAARAAKSIREYGEALFEQVFQDRRAYAKYDALRGYLRDTQWVIESRSPEFQALHWEALQDPDSPRPISVESSMTRRAEKTDAVQAAVKPSPVINLLVVTARPDEEADVGYRTISRPLIEAIQTARLRVNVDLLRPGTFEALARHLEAKGAGFYHIIHLDVHGVVGTYDQINKGMEDNQYLYHYAQRKFQPYKGNRAFVFMEGDHKGEANPVQAEDLADLLTGKGIPVCILNACQSAKQVNGNEGLDHQETSLGSLLMAAGMQMVVAMRYSVTVSAAKIVMEQIYRTLFDQPDMAEAIRLGRLELLNRKERRAYYNYQVNLEDWLLPVVYQNQRVDLNLREFTPQEEEEYFEALDQQEIYEAPTYGFVGRDLEILKIERALLHHNVLLVRGMGGTGKTTVLKYLQDWWRTTQFVREVFYFGYDERAWTLEQIVFEIGQRVYDRFELGRFQAMSLRAQMQKLGAKLKAEPYGLMLDNLESVTGEPLAIQNTLNDKQQSELKDFLRLLVGGRSQVILGSRSGETWLQAETFGGNIYELRGLDGESRTVLAERILERQVKSHKRIESLLKDQEFDRLMKVLAGYPLAMEVVLANLAQQSPQEILQALEGADVDLNAGGNARTDNILKCVDYSHGNLSPAAQQLLICLAPFSGFIDRTDLPNYSKQLQTLEIFQEYPFAQWDEAIQEAVDWGLLSPMMAEAPHLLSIQPIFPYFLKAKLNHVEQKLREGLFTGFTKHYRGLAGQYYQLLQSKEQQKRQLGLFFCKLEYENLYNALKFCLQQTESFAVLFACLYMYLELQNDYRAEVQLSKYVLNQISSYPEEFLKQKENNEFEFVLDYLGNGYLKTKQYSLAKEAYQKKLDFIVDSGNRDEQARTYHQLGIIAEELREWEEAKNNYNKALDLFIELSDRYSQARPYHQLGIVAQKLRQWEEARNNYNKALKIFIEFNDRYSQARTYHQLGRVAEELREWEEARDNYNKALKIKIEFSDRYSQAGTYHQLGRVAQKLRQWEEARNNYNKALKIFIEFSDRYSQAGTYQGLGAVAQALREWQEVRDNYNKALKIYIEFGDRYEQAGAYHNLGTIAQKLGEWQEARDNYNKALKIYIEFNDRYSQARTHFHLAQIDEEVGDLAQAKAGYLKALQVFIEFNDEYSLDIVCRDIARFYKLHPDDVFLSEVAKVFGTETAELKQIILSAEE